MNKPLQSSGSAYRAFRTGVALFAMLFVFGVSSALAQADVVSSTTLSGSQGAVKANIPTSSSATFVSNSEAMTILKSEISTLQSNTFLGESEIGVRVSYLTSILKSLGQGGNIADIYDNSGNELYAIVNQYANANQPDFATIRQNLFDLVTL